MNRSLLFLTFGLCLSMIKAEVDGTLTMEINGQDHSLYPVSMGSAGQNISVEGRKLTITAGGNAFMAKEAINDF